jgi:hypothetical protein
MTGALKQDSSGGQVLYQKEIWMKLNKHIVIKGKSMNQIANF